VGGESDFEGSVFNFSSLGGVYKAGTVKKVAET
jgi:hypothetical protein